MVPSSVILQAMQDLLAQDPGTLAPAALALHVHLAKAAFTPSPDRVVGDFTEADFTGGTAKNAGVGACQEFFDTTSGLRVIQLNEPAGGWHWAVTAGANLPQTIFGFYVTDNGDAILYGCALLTSPISLTISGQAIDIPWIRFTMVANPLT